MRYAPYIDGTIPAFTANGEIKVPFEHNLAVGEGAAARLTLLIKDLDSNIITSLSSTNITNNIATFGIDEEIKNKLQIGQYYKVQLGYTEENVNDIAWSSIGITKYIGESVTFTVSIENSNTIALDYSCSDPTEKLYEVEVSCEGFETFITKYSKENITLPYNLLNGKEYKIKVKGKTINLYEVNAEESYNETNVGIDEGVMEDLSFEVNKEYAIISTTPQSDYKIIRAIDINGTQLTQVPDSDNTFEIGKPYYYGLMDDAGNYSFLETLITCYAQDMFLQDSSRMLRIQFNPKVSGYKRVVQESKQTTLGGKYPIFFRNGNNYYSEFSISGLISYHADLEEKFIEMDNYFDSDDAVRAKTNQTSEIEAKIKTTNLVGYNIYAEKEFREKVLDWLNNGQPKLFRSPTEGNFIVRLMNVSLTPEERLGRMLYTFNCNAVECSNDINDVYSDGIIKSGNEIIGGISLVDLDKRYILKEELDDSIEIISGGLGQ